VAAPSEPPKGAAQKQWTDSYALAQKFEYRYFLSSAEPVRPRPITRRVCRQGAVPRDRHDQRGFAEDTKDIPTHLRHAILAAKHSDGFSAPGATSSVTICRR